MPKTGQNHHNARLTDEQVKDMRRLYAEWKKQGANSGYETLAAIYKCGVSTARDIITYRTRYNA